MEEKKETPVIGWTCPACGAVNPVSNNKCVHGCVMNEEVVQRPGQLNG